MSYDVFGKWIKAGRGHDAWVKYEISDIATGLLESSRRILMKYYIVVELNVTDESWVPAYLENVTRMVEEAGGRYLARTSQIEKLEGDREQPELFVIIEFPSKEAATSLLASAEYQPYLKQRQAGSQSELLLVAGEDIAIS